ncbi:uncharacterized protein LOC117635945 [Prunus dulcis]|uniref:uncharacterized protein LOC117635945 n=1 Tax=Prunus dulcis TaxID=3755 RepID=UPI0014827B12|nr:uncharacterized protein LOC117635945 [Prunus dulcis]
MGRRVLLRHISSPLMRTSHQILSSVSQKACCIFESSVGCLGLVGDQEGHTCEIHCMNLILVLAVLVLQWLVGLVELHVLEIELSVGHSGLVGNHEAFQFHGKILVLVVVVVEACLVLQKWLLGLAGHMWLQVLEIELRVGSLGMVGYNDEGQSCEFHSMNIAQWLLGLAGHVENKVLEME